MGLSSGDWERPQSGGIEAWRRLRVKGHLISIQPHREGAQGYLMQDLGLHFPTYILVSLLLF